MKNLIVVSCAALLLTSCSEDATAPNASNIDLNSDRALRGHLDVNALVGGIRVPEDAVAYVVTTLEYEDGKLMHQGHATDWRAEPDRSPYVSAQLLWGEVEGEPRATLALGGAISRDQGDFWAKLGSGSTWWGHDAMHEEFEGYTVLGMSWSGAYRVGHENSGAGGGMKGVVEKRRHVGALVVKFFPTTQEAVDHVHLIRKQNDARRKAAKAEEEGYFLVELEHDGATAALLAGVVRATGFGAGRAVVHDGKASVILRSADREDLARTEAEVRAKEKLLSHGVRVVRVAWKLGALPEAPEQKEVPITDVSLDRERLDQFGVSSGDVTRVLQEFRKVYPGRSTEEASRALLEATVETPGGELVPLKAVATLIRQQSLRPIVLELP